MTSSTEEYNIILKRLIEKANSVDLLTMTIFEELLDNYETVFFTNYLKSFVEEVNILIKNNCKSVSEIFKLFTYIELFITKNFIDSPEYSIYSWELFFKLYYEKYELIFYLITKMNFDLKLTIHLYGMKYEQIELIKRYIKFIKPTLESKLIKQYFMDLLTKCELIEHFDLVTYVS